MPFNAKKLYIFFEIVLHSYLIGTPYSQGAKSPCTSIQTYDTYFFAVVGRCVPAIFADIANSINDALVTDDNTTVVDKLGNAVNGTFLEEATK